MDIDFDSRRNLLLRSLDGVQSATRTDINTDWDIERKVEIYLERDPELIETVIGFFERCEIYELKCRLAPVILSFREYKPAYDISIELGRTPEWLYEYYESVRSMAEKGMIKI